MKPAKTILFLFGVFSTLAVVMAMVPAKGIDLGFFTFHMPSFGEMFSEEDQAYKDVSAIIESQFDIDTIEPVESDSIQVSGDSMEIRKADYDSLIQSIQRLELSELGRSKLDSFFFRLKNDSTARVLHYGDSQIEGDRITSYVRNKLQVRFGGSGPGLRPAVQPYDYVFSAVQSNSQDWERYPVFGKIDSTVLHSSYGIMGAFARFAPLACDSIPQMDSILYKGELNIRKSDIAYNRVKNYRHLRLFYGNSQKPVELQVVLEGDTLVTDTLSGGLDYAVLSVDLPDTTDNISLCFSGYDSPDIYGIELGDTSGVLVDNIALRGSSGTIFTKLDAAHSSRMFQDLNPDLILLQFGGNVMPYIKDQKAIERYGRWFKAQIRHLQEICPKAAILVIGPSDMSTKVKDSYVTYEYLPNVVTVLRDVALDTGSGYWDMYSAMGGENSMPGWVNADPELARPDYTHFSARGARLIANMFYNALILEYNEFTVGKNEK